MSDRARMDRLWSAVSAEFPTVSNGGIFNCRRIAGSSTWSQHAYSNALDIMVPDLRTGDLVNQWLERNRDQLDIGTIIWRSPNHYDHLHVEGPVRRTGTPECAGGSDVNPDQGRDPSNTGGDSGGGFDPFGIGGIIGVLTDSETWIRTLWLIGGSFLIGYALVMFLRELGVTPPLPSNQIAQLLGGR